MTTIEVGKFYKTDKNFKVEVIAIRGVDVIFISSIDYNQIRGIAAGVEHIDWAKGEWTPWIDEPAIPWDSVPPWLTWWAVDLDGEQFYYESKPIQHQSDWSGKVGSCLIVPKAHRIPYTGNWNESLRQRPGKEVAK
jgi:hypothetical protein